VIALWLGGLLAAVTIACIVLVERLREAERCRDTLLVEMQKTNEHTIAMLHHERVADEESIRQYEENQALRREIDTLVAARRLDAALLDKLETAKRPKLVKPIRVRRKSEKKR
jgi:hypothetical protein